MKITVRILAVWGCIATAILLYQLVVYLDAEGIVEFRRKPGTDYYYPADLKTMNLPTWNPTNSIPLSPDAAVRAAMKYANEKNPNSQHWDVDRLSFEKYGNEGIWTYEVDVIDRQSGSYATEYIRVLMDGTIWKPTQEERKN